MRPFVPKNVWYEGRHDGRASSQDGLHKPRNRGRATIDGKTVYFPGEFNSPESLRAYDATIVEWRKRQAKREDEPLTGGQVVLLFDEHTRSYFRKHGQLTSEYGLHQIAFKPLVALFGRKHVADFGPRDLKAVRAEFITAGMVRKSCNAHARRIVRLFAWLVEDERCPVAVVTALEKVRNLQAGRSEAVESAPVKPVEDRDVNLGLPHVSTVVRDMIRIQLLTAARPGEICILRPCDVDRSRSVWHYRPTRFKSQHHEGASRVACIGPRGQAVLERFDNRPADAYCFSPAESIAESRAERRANRKTPEGRGNGPGTNRRERPKKQPGDRFTTASYGKAVALGIRKANDAIRAENPKVRLVQHWTPHQLRHAAAMLIRSQFDLESAKTALGHCNVTTTEIYAVEDIAKAERIMSEIG